MRMYITVLQSDDTALKKSVREHLSIGYWNKDVYFYIDSHAALKALDSNELISNLVWDCFKTTPQQQFNT